MKSTPWIARLLPAAAIAASLYAVMLVYASGQTLLAVMLLAVAALAVWAYTSARTMALRYLFPGVAAALAFVIFPMLYTLSMGFTNQSSTNLLTAEEARAYLVNERVMVADSERAFQLVADASATRVQVAGLVSTTLTRNATPPHASALTPGIATGRTLTMRETVALLPDLRALTLTDPEGKTLTLASLRSFAQFAPLYIAEPDGALVDRVTGTRYLADPQEGFYTSAAGDRLQPGYRVNVGFRHFARILGEEQFRSPFVSVFIWTVLFSALSIIGAAGLGLVLSTLLNWQRLRFRGAYRLVLFLPYAVPGFISILIFKGLFNQNLGEVNLILNALFGVKPAWFSDPLLAKTMLLIVNIWLGFPYMMVLCSGLIQSIPADLYEASAVAGAGPWANFWRITMPLIMKPLTPLLISAFAFNFNNFVLISLLTNGRPDYVDATLPAGTTDILVSYTWRLAFQDSGQQFGLAAAISTLIFLIVAAITLLQMRFSRVNTEATKEKT